MVKAEISRSVSMVNQSKAREMWNTSKNKMCSLCLGKKEKLTNVYDFKNIWMLIMGTYEAIVHMELV